MNRVAFVTPWFGPALAGEAQQRLFQVTTRLARRGHKVEVLTTCCGSPQDDWGRDQLAPGVTEESGVIVRRFPVRPRSSAAFDGASRELAALDGRPKLLGTCPVSPEAARAFVEESIRSEKLLAELERQRDQYEAIVFAPCSVGLTLLGLERAGRRAFLLPMLRDETAAYLPAVEAVFDKCRRILFGSEQEATLAARIFGPFVWRKSAITGEDASAQPDWDQVIDRYEEGLALRRQQPRIGPPARRSGPRAIHQLLPSLDYGDAISNQAVFIAEVLRDLGYESEIFVFDIGAPMRDFATRFTPSAIAPNAGLLYHHAIGTALTPHAIEHPGPKALVYHNITPGHFFEPWDAKFAGILDWGRKDLHNLAPAFPISVGDSTYNADELREAGFRDPTVMPIFVEPGRWAQPADPGWMKTLQDGRTNILFVGRVAPNKCHHHLIEAFHEYLAHDRGARLVLAGGAPEGHPYGNFLRDLIERLGIAEQVVMTGKVTDAQLLACYRTAHLFWSMSEHEGFCVPLIEALWFDVPVLAYRSTAIPETLGKAGIMFTEKRFPELAALAHLLVEDQALRRKVIAAQRARRPAFLPEAILPVLLQLIAKMTAPLAAAAVDQPPTFETSSQYASMIRGQR